MKRLLVLALFILGMTSIVQAQDQVAVASSLTQNAAADFSQTSAASAYSQAAAIPYVSSTFATPLDLSFSSEANTVSRWAFSSAASTTASPSASFADPQPPSPSPRFGYGNFDDFRWELGMGIALVRLRTSVFNATAIGFQTSVAYYMSDWLALEADVLPAFGGQLNNETVKYLSYGAGPKVFWRRPHLEPWVHVLVGGVHVIPQTALGSQNGFELTAGGGGIYRVNPRFSLKLELDWLRSNLYGQTQNSAQAVLGGAVHF
jgi:hypothetical protein